ncbi:MAG: leucine-rich repeat domain-containing protein [Clostridiales bacterium]|nr:leucine-rich repeat domain-containing protein [Clostridiales bacterium]
MNKYAGDLPERSIMMPVLQKQYIEESYFEENADYSNVIQELSEYKGEERICVSCTQLAGKEYAKILSDIQTYSERDKKRILAEWIDFLQTNPKALKAIHFRSHVPQRLFDAACCQENLEELHFKWGNYTDLSALENLKKLKYLYLGAGSGIQDITPLSRLDTLIVLHVVNLKRIEDYSPLTALPRLEQLVISGPNLGKTPIKDLDFLIDMKSLLSFWRPGTTLRKKYTPDERESLLLALPNLSFCYNSRL